MNNSRFIKQFNVDKNIHLNSFNELTQYEEDKCESGFLKNHIYCGFPSKEIELQVHKQYFRKLIHGPTIEKQFKDKNGEYMLPSYSTNEFGFRSDSWLDGEEGSIFLGCSDTFGMSQFWEKTWPYLLSKNIGGKIYNLALPGATLDTCYRVLKSHIDYINGEYVFLLIPELTRSEFCDNMGKFHFLSGGTIDYYSKSKRFNDAAKYYVKYKNNALQLWVDYSRNLDAIKYICYKAKKKFVSLHNFIYIEDTHKKDISQDWAFDCRHLGLSYQKKVKELFLKKLKLDKESLL